MAYKTKFDGNTTKTIQLGGKNNSTNQDNPTSLEGYFLGSKDTQSDYGPGKLHVFLTEEGSVGVWGKTRLDKLLTSDLIGQMVLVTFAGMIAPSKKGRRPSYGYKVQHDPENTTDTSGIDLNAAPPASEDNDDSDDNNIEASSYESEESYDEPAPTPVRVPVAPASVADEAKRAKVQALLAKSRSTARS